MKQTLGNLERQLFAYAQMRGLRTLRTGDLAKALGISAKQESKLFSVSEVPVKVIGGRLFRVELVFPSNVPTGHYAAEIYLFKNGRPVSISRKTLDVRREGVEATIFQFAHQHAAIYGILAIVVALLAGWLAGVIFRRV